MNWRRLADAVITRRVELGMTTQQALAERTGLTRRLLGDIEHARRENYDPATIARIEQGLQWLPGSVRDVLAGGEPSRVEDITLTSPVDRTGDEFDLLSMLAVSGLPRDDVLRIVDYIRGRRAQQHEQLVNEVRDLIIEAGGVLPPRPRRGDRTDVPSERVLPEDRSGLGGNARRR